MAQLIADLQDVAFALYDQMKVEGLLTHDRYRDLNRKTMDLILKEARNFGIKEILPTRAEGDEQGLSFEGGEVHVPECYKRVHKLLLAAEYTSPTENPAVGGQGLPHLFARAASEYIVGANWSLVTYPFTGHGTGKMIELYGNAAQKERFLEKLYTAAWGGTMVLTEPQAGSDVGAITTTATDNGDGTYSIRGDKIFITNGEHDLSENIIHPVLARIEGDPPGTKGISIFLVPKYWVNDDGSLGERNDVVCTGIEKKMGIKGSATCAMAFGAKGRCRGHLLGNPRQGMEIMFHMMNETRLEVGFMGFCHASNAYLYALDYARQRIQGRELGSDSHDSVPIIRHPDVRRMLIWMKAHVEGMRSLIYYVSRCLDEEALAVDEDQKNVPSGRIALLTPIVKAYCAQRGFEACSMAMQVYGGSGYIRDYPVEQLTRDCRIAAIFEGTDGIQAMDLLGRKLGMGKGEVFMDILGEIQATVTAAKAQEGLADLGEGLETAAGQLAATAQSLGARAMSVDVKTAFAHAYPFLMAFGDVIMAWMLLWRANTAAPLLKKRLAEVAPEARPGKIAKDKKAAFYDGQHQTARYFIKNLLPVTLGQMRTIQAGDAAAVKIGEAGFGGL
jgi:alkylation response protein AidB-like acyl-CoA dehydrogenase